MDWRPFNLIIGVWMSISAYIEQYHSTAGPSHPAIPVGMLVVGGYLLWNYHQSVRESTTNSQTAGDTK